MRALTWSSFCAVACLLAGCESDDVVDTTIEHPTLVEVAPETFLGSLPCSDAPGAVQRYVATLTDVTETGDAGVERRFTLPSSQPLSCTRAVGFSFVVPGNRYMASIDAYDRSDISPLAPGLPDMVDPSGARVAPRWTSRCETPVTAVRQRSQRARGCTPLVDQAPAGDTAVSVDLSGALGDFECGSDAGQIVTYSVRLEYLNPDLTGSTQTGDCGEPLVFGDLVPGEPVTLSITAFEAGALEPTLGTTCTATTVERVTTAAVCEPLVGAGAVAIDVPALLSAFDLSCDEGATLRAEAAAPVAQSFELSGSACERPLTIGEIEVAELGVDRQVLVTVEAFGADGQCAAVARCVAEPVPGQVVTATCAAPEACSPAD